MSRYIDADALIFKLKTQDYSCAPDTLEDWTPEDMTKCEIADIEHAPTADVRENVHGEWLDHQNGRWIYAKCSICGTIHDTKTNFCPNCGAEMRDRDLNTGIIQCDECKHYINHDKRCGLLNHGMKDDDFCSKGERRDE